MAVALSHSVFGDFLHPQNTGSRSDGAEQSALGASEFAHEQQTRIIATNGTRPAT